MFEYTDIGAFILRLAIFMLLFTTYPLVAYFLNDILINLFFKSEAPGPLMSLILNLSITFVPLMFALFYPNIGTVLSYISALSGFLIIYIYPVLVYLKHMRTQIENPLLAEAIQNNEF